MQSLSHMVEGDSPSYLLWGKQCYYRSTSRVEERSYLLVSGSGGNSSFIDTAHQFTQNNEVNLRLFHGRAVALGLCLLSQELLCAQWGTALPSPLPAQLSANISQTFMAFSQPGKTIPFCSRVLLIHFAALYVRTTQLELPILPCAVLCCSPTGPSLLLNVAQYSRSRNKVPSGVLHPGLELPA